LWSGLDELCARFLNNLPQEELQEFSRIGMHLEEAQWFYEDFIRPLNPTTLPNLRIRDFSLRILQHCPVTSFASLDILEKAYDNWVAYKKRIPVRGLIMLNEAMDSAVLVKGWKSSANWSFPRGKINQEEDDLHCAVREVYEETGFNVEEAGLIPNPKKVKYFEQTIRDQHLRLYVIPNVPMDTYFEPRTRKEISKIQWYKLIDLPGRVKKKQGQDNTTGPNASKFYMVAPFVEPLNRWIKQEIKKKEKIRNSRRTGPALQAEIDEVMTEEEGTATETRADLPPPPDAKDHVHEAATREIQRLLRIQPHTQATQPEPSDLNQDRGHALLAMLQQQRDAPGDSQASRVQPDAHIPHTPMDHVQNVAPIPQNPHHNHSSHQLPAYQTASLTFPFQSDMDNQLLSDLGAADTSVRPGAQQLQATYQQSQVQPPPNIATQPGLIHPQPLPRQANNLLASVLGPNSASDKRVAQMHQQASMWPQMAADMAVPQHSATNSYQPPAPLDSTRQALLDAFKKTTTSAQQLVQQSPSSNKRIEATQRPKPQLTAQNLAALASTYTPGQHGTQAIQIPINGSPQIAAAQAALRPANVPESQRNALLGIFKQATTASPTRHCAQLDLKENSASKPQQQHPALLGAGSSATQMINRSLQPSLGLPYGAPYGATYDTARPGAADQRSALSQQLGLGSYPIQNIGCAPHSQPTASVPSSGTAQLGQPPVQGGMASLPNIVQQHQPPDPQQLQKLMSLFNKPPPTTAGTQAPPSNACSQVPAQISKEPNSFNMGKLVAQLPNMSSNLVPPGTSQGLDEAAGSATLSRRGSQQAPISPENEKFLLNYLKTVSSSAK
jgi:mRNA-decapping enzyme subunit 2